MKKLDPAAGFSLIELIIVIMVVGILAVAFIPKTTTEGIKLEAAAARLAADIRAAQSQAIFRGNSQTISSTGGTSYTARGEQIEMLDGVTTTSFSITFDSLGEPTGGAETITLTANTKTKSISVKQLTGQVSIQ